MGVVDFLGDVWNDVTGAIKTVYYGSTNAVKEGYRYVTKQDAPDLLPGADPPGAAGSQEMIIFFDYHVDGYRDLLKDKRAEMAPFQKAVNDIDATLEANKAAKVDLIHEIRHTNRDLEGAERESKFFSSSSSMGKKIDKKIVDLDTARHDLDAKIQSDNPVYVDTLLGHGSITTNLARRFYQSELIPMEKEAERLEEQVERSLYWRDQAIDAKEAKEDADL